ncbi:MAG: Ku protein [Opitutaceae bacterium]|nr:Ku protein [Opitutaceae bacterium]
MRPIWKGAISFGLVTIPVQILNATRHEELKFRMLRKQDLSAINYKRVAEVDGKEVPWDDIVKGFEYEKGKFVVMEEKDFDKVELQGTDSIEILDFVDESGVNPIYFHKPYYIEPMKGGASAYALLRDVLADTEKIGIAKVVIRNRQHLAAVKANGSLLVLELMHFASEITPADTVKVPAVKETNERALGMARQLVAQMSAEWDPEKYSDDYATAVMKLIERKVEAGGKELPGAAKRHAPAPSNVIDLVEVLQKSLAESGGRSAPAANRVKRRSPVATKRGATKSGGKKRGTHKHAA